MSLLIKALDSAEKNNKSKKPGEDQANPPLELEAIEPKTPPKNSEADTNAQELITAKPKTNFADLGLSLEEEAGLPLEPDPKYAKPKRPAEKPVKPSYKPVDKPASNEKASKTSVQETASEVTAQPQAPVLPPVFQTIAAQNNELHQKAAAKVFVANQAVKNDSSKSALIILGIAGALLIWLGLQGYSYIKTMLAPEVVVVKPSVPIVRPQEAAAVAADAAQVTQDSTETQVNVDNSAPPLPAGEAEQPQATASNAVIGKPESTKPKNTVEANDSALVVADTDANALVAAKPLVKANRSKKTNSDDSYGENDAASQGGRNTIKLVSKQPVNGVDPTLLSAYQAFSRGEYPTAQQQYRQVLQRDVRNVDALLGMAAIAQRQGRDADAYGWYQKVLEIEPKNTIAQSALINAQANADSTGAESRIKSMLAQQPEAAHLYAALGNLYASQSQWPAAQEAYFNASRYAPNNADYAFNLAVSLDQLGKSSLALAQYQRALDIVNQTGAISPDKTQLETRIRTLQ